MEAVARGLEAEAVPATASVLMVAPAARGGIARHVISLLTGLDRDGYRVGVACPKEGQIAEAARERSLPLYPLTVGSGTRPSRAAVGVLHLVGAISHLQAHIVHAHSFGAGLVGALAMPLARSARLVATIHNYPPGGTAGREAAEQQGQESQGSDMRPRRASHRWAIGQIVRRAARLITVSDALRNELLALYPEVAAKTVTIPNGIDARAKPGRDPQEVKEALDIPPAGPLVGMVARLAPQKGIGEFIRACRAVADHRPDVRFVLAGEGPLRSMAEAMRDRLGLGDRLHLTGEVESTSDLIAALDCLVVASTSEGSSLAAMEGMAMAKPVVATCVGGVPEVVADGETGVLVPPGEPAALAAAVQALLQDPERAQALGEQGRRRAAEQFDVRLMLARTEQIYADLVHDDMKAGGHRG